MGTDVGQQKQTAEQQAPGKKPTAPSPGMTGRDGLKQSLRSMNYEEGAKALSPAGEGAGDPKKAEEERRAAELKAWQEALGTLIGGKLYEIVSKEVSPDKVLKHANAVVDALLDAAVKEAGGLDKLDPEGKKPATALAGVLAKILDEQATAWLETKDGKAFAQKVSGYVGAHPWQVVAAILLAGVSAVAANVSLPELKQKFGIAKGLDAEVKAKLGKIREISLEAISLRLTYEAGKLKAEAGADRDAEGKVTGTVGASYGDDKGMVSAAATIDEQGLTTATVGAKGKSGNTSGEVTGGYSRDKGYTADARVSYGTKERTLAGAAHYDGATNSVSVKLSEEIVKDLEGHYRAVTIDREGVGTESRDRIGTEKNNITLSTATKGENSKVGVSYTRDDLKVALDAAFAGETATGKASVEARLTERTTAGGDATIDLHSGRLAEMGVHFGYRDPKEFEAFLIEYRRKMAGEMPEDRFRLTVEHTIGKLMMRGQNETVLKGGDLSYGRVSGHLAYPINKDFAIIGGVTQGYGRDRDVGTMPQIGVQVRSIPVMVGYDTNSKAWRLGITIPFGR